MPQTQHETPSTRFEDPRHSVVEAWLSLSTDHTRPVVLLPVRDLPGHDVFYLEQAPAQERNWGRIGQPGVIGRWVSGATAQLEQAVCTEVFPRITNPMLHWFGATSPDTRDRCWVFTEYAGNQHFDPRQASHRILVGRWLAALHLATADVSPPSVVPLQNAVAFREHLNIAEKALEKHVDNAELDDRHRPYLRAVLAQCHVIQSRWDELVELCASAPQVLVHGDLAARNLRVRTRDGVTLLLAFDWEDAAWGLPAIDLLHARPNSTCEAANPDLLTYCDAVRHRWPHLDISYARQLGLIGKLFWFLVALRWDAQYISTEYTNRHAHHIRLHRAGLADTMRALNWAAPQQAPGMSPC